MRKILNKIKLLFRLKKDIKRQLDMITRSTDCVNLSISRHSIKYFVIYNNSDAVCKLTLNELIGFAMLGKPFFSLIIYALCVKNSIEKL